MTKNPASYSCNRTACVIGHFDSTECKSNTEPPKPPSVKTEGEGWGEGFVYRAHPAIIAFDSSRNLGSVAEAGVYAAKSEGCVVGDNQTAKRAVRGRWAAKRGFSL